MDFHAHATLVTTVPECHAVTLMSVLIPHVTPTRLVLTQLVVSPVPVTQVTLEMEPHAPMLTSAHPTHVILTPLAKTLKV